MGTDNAAILDLERQSLGPIRLGDDVAAAKSLGSPQRTLGKPDEGDCTLEFPGFDLEFIDGRLACVKFVLGRNSVVECAGGIQLKRATRPLDVQVWFGDPASDSNDGNTLRWIDFERDGATLALEFDVGGLSCVQLYA